MGMESIAAPTTMSVSGYKLPFFVLLRNQRQDPAKV